MRQKARMKGFSKMIGPIRVSGTSQEKAQRATHPHLCVPQQTHSGSQRKCWGRSSGSASRCHRCHKCLGSTGKQEVQDRIDLGHGNIAGEGGEATWRQETQPGEVVNLDRVII